MNNRLTKTLIILSVLTIACFQQEKYETEERLKDSFLKEFNVISSSIPANGSSSVSIKVVEPKRSIDNIEYTITSTNGLFENGEPSLKFKIEKIEFADSVSREKSIKLTSSTNPGRAEITLRFLDFQDTTSVVFTRVEPDSIFATVENQLVQPFLDFKKEVTIKPRNGSGGISRGHEVEVVLLDSTLLNPFPLDRDIQNPANIEYRTNVNGEVVVSFSVGETTYGGINPRKLFYFRSSTTAEDGTTITHDLPLYISDQSAND